MSFLKVEIDIVSISPLCRASARNIIHRAVARNQLFSAQLCDNFLVKTFAEKLIKLRQEKNLTQGALAKQLNIGEATIRYWENGRREPLLSNVIMLAKFFNVTLDEMAGLTD